MRPDPRTPDIETLLPVLAGVRYPAQRWEVIAEAQDYGATDFWIEALLQLPARSYRDLRDLTEAFARRLAEAPAGPEPGGGPSGGQAA